MSEVVYSVVNKNKDVISGVKLWLFYCLLREHDIYLLNWIRVDFTPQIQINKQTNSEECVRIR